MFDGLVQTATDRSQMSETLTATHAGFALEGHGDRGSLYEASNGNTYFVPFIRSGLSITPVVSETEQVLTNPTGQYQDMTFAPVPASVLDNGLRAALETEIRNRNPRAIAEQRLAFG